MTDLDMLPTSGECVLTLMGFSAVVSVLSALLFARTEFHVCNPKIDCKFASACGLYSPQLSAEFISARCFANRCPKSNESCLLSA